MATINGGTAPFSYSWREQSDSAIHLQGSSAYTVIDYGTYYVIITDANGCEITSNIITFTSTWDCIVGTCVDPEDDSGMHSSLLDCNTACLTPSWDCIQNTCVDPGTGQGAYISLASCTTACVGTAINEVTSELLIYPNPATDKLVVESNAKGIVYIKNLLGKTIYKTRKSDYLLEVNTSQFAKGIYILQLNGMCSKVLIQ